MAGLPFCSLFNLFNCRLILTNLSFVFVLLSLNFQNWFWWAHLRINRVKRSQEFRLIRFIKSLYATLSHSNSNLFFSDENTGAFYVNRESCNFFFLVIFFLALSIILLIEYYLCFPMDDLW